MANVFEQRFQTLNDFNIIWKAGSFYSGSSFKKFLKHEWSKVDIVDACLTLKNDQIIASEFGLRHLSSYVIGLSRVNNQKSLIFLNEASDACHALKRALRNIQLSNINLPQGSLKPESLTQPVFNIQNFYTSPIERSFNEFFQSAPIPALYAYFEPTNNANVLSPGATMPKHTQTHSTAELLESELSAIPGDNTIESANIGFETSLQPISSTFTTLSTANAFQSPLLEQLHIQDEKSFESEIKSVLGQDEFRFYDDLAKDASQPIKRKGDSDVRAIDFENADAFALGADLQDQFAIPSHDSDSLLSAKKLAIDELASENTASTVTVARPLVLPSILSSSPVKFNSYSSVSLITPPRERPKRTRNLCPIDSETQLSLSEIRQPHLQSVNDHFRLKSLFPMKDFKAKVAWDSYLNPSLNFEWHISKDLSFEVSEPRLSLFHSPKVAAENSLERDSVVEENEFILRGLSPAATSVELLRAEQQTPAHLAPWAKLPASSETSTKTSSRRQSLGLSSLDFSLEGPWRVSGAESSRVSASNGEYTGASLPFGEQYVAAQVISSPPQSSPPQASALESPELDKLASTDEQDFFAYVSSIMKAANSNVAYFKDLVPPLNTSRSVATAAFLHILSLGSKGLISLSQAGSFSDIQIQVLDSTKL